MANIIVKDIFEELVEENEKITECLNVLIRFKTFVDLIYDKLKTNLEPNVIEMFDDFHKEVEDVFKRNERQFSVRKNTDQRKTDLIEFLSTKPQTSDSNSLQLSSDQSNDSKEPKTNDIRPRLVTKKKKSCFPRTPKICYPSLSQMESTEEYLIDENNEFVCTHVGCGKRLKDRDGWRAHHSIHSEAKIFRCDYEGCDYTTKCSNRTGIIGHINAHKGIKPFDCKFCGNQFAAQKYLLSHIKYKHKVSDQLLICQMDNCYKRFRTEYSMKNHQRFLHLRERRFACEETNCQFKTFNESLLRRHLTIVHSDLRPFVCTFEGCSKSYKTNCELQHHIECHSSERKHKCPHPGCEKAFRTSKTLKNHISLHTSLQMSCDWPGCEYTSNCTTSLRKHRGIHSSEKNFSCVWPQCGKWFKTKTQLDTHHRIHNSDKKYACSWPGCHYRCTDSGNLVKHKRVHIKN